MAPRPSDGLGWGLHLHRYHHHRDWPRLLETMVPEEHRPGAEDYLRGIATRMRAARAVRSQAAVQSTGTKHRREADEF